MKLKFTLLTVFALITASLCLTQDLERGDIKMVTGWLDEESGSQRRVSYYFATEEDSLFYLDGNSGVVSSIMPDFDIGSVNALGNGYFATTKGLFKYEYGEWLEFPSFSNREVIQIIHNGDGTALFVTANTLEQFINENEFDTLYQLHALTEDELNHQISYVSHKTGGCDYLISVITTMKTGDVTKDLYYLFTDEEFDSTDLVWSSHTTRDDSTKLYGLFTGNNSDILLFDSTKAIILDISDIDQPFSDTVTMNSPVTLCSAAPTDLYTGSRSANQFIAISNACGSFILGSDGSGSLKRDLEMMIEYENGDGAFNDLFGSGADVGGVQLSGLNFMVLSTSEGLFHYYNPQSTPIMDHRAVTQNSGISLDSHNHLKLPDSVKSGDIQVMDYRGRLLLNEPFSNAGGFSLSLESRGWAKGNYFIKVNSDDGVYNSKINIK